MDKLKAFETFVSVATNLLHAGYCQFMRVHERSCGPHFPSLARVF